jgi:hypothetical protein
MRWAGASAFAHSAQRLFFRAAPQCLLHCEITPLPLLTRNNTVAPTRLKETPRQCGVAHSGQGAVLWLEGAMKVIGAFDPEATAAMTAAYGKACQSMHDWEQPEILKDIIAKRIIDVAADGERDPDMICERALRLLGFCETPSIR